MKNKFKQDIKVLSSMTDSNAKVGPIYALSYLQDNMSEYFKHLGCDGISMLASSKCFWVMSKTKVQFDSLPGWLDMITLETSVQKITPIRLNLSNNILNGDGEIAIRGLQEICAMDSDTRRLKTIKSTLLPSNITPTNESNSLEFSRMDFELGVEKLAKEIVIDSTRIDYFGHTNNVEYAKIFMSTLSGNELKILNPKVFEIHYISESKEGENLQVYKEKIENKYLFEIKNNDKVVCKAVLGL